MNKPELPPILNTKEYEALAREEGITPEVFEIETNIYVEAVYFNS